MMAIFIFLQLSSLRILDLSNNHLRELPYDFGGLCGLEQLDLTANEYVLSTLS